MLAVLIALVLMVILVYVVALYYMRRKERAFVSSQAEMIRRTMLLEETQGQLEEKRLQSQSLLQKLRHSEMQENADDVIARVRLAADGKRRTGSVCSLPSTASILTSAICCSAVYQA